MNKLVGILLVVYNEKHNLSLLLNSLKRQTHQNFIIYFIDNGSSDNSIEFTKELNTHLKLQIKYFPQKENTGFAGGNNIAAKEAGKDDCDYMFTLNNDTELDNECIKELINLLESDKKIGVVGPILFFWNKEKLRNQVQFYGAKVDFNKYKVIENYSGKVFEDIKDSLPIKLYVDHVPGGATFIPTDLYRHIGLWDERYFIYGDEIDLSKRVIGTGLRLAVSYKAKVWHNHKFLTKNKKGYYLEYYLIARNKFIYYYKYNLYSRIIIGFIIDMIRFPFKLFWFKKVCDWKLGTYYFKGIFAGILNRYGKPNFLSNK